LLFLLLFLLSCIQTVMIITFVEHHLSSTHSRPLVCVSLVSSKLALVLPDRWVYSRACIHSMFTDGLPYKFSMNILGLYSKTPKFTAIMDIIRLLWIIRIVWAVEGKSMCLCQACML